MSNSLLKERVHPKEYMIWLEQLYGKDWFKHTIAPETIWLDFKDQFKVEPNDLIKNKINAVQTILMGTVINTVPAVFEKCILALNDTVVDIRIWQACSPKELNYGIKLIEDIKGKQDYDDNIRGYVVACCNEWGLVYYPDYLAQFQPTYPTKSFSNAIYQDIKSDDIKMKESKWQVELIKDIRDYFKERVK